MNGEVANLFVKRKHGQAMDQVDTLQTIANEGILGDASFGRTKRQILIVEKEILEQFNVKPGELRENLTVSGMRLSEIPTGSMLHVGDTVLEVTGDCKPCDMLNDLHSGMREKMDGQRGVLARVIEEGSIRVGDPVIQLQSNDN